MLLHQAPEQMLGYLYQIEYALYMLLNAEKDTDMICVERFDDISVEHDDGSHSFAQLKHHIKATGDLSDHSVDLWRTLKVWIDSVNDDYSLLSTATFLIITTAKEISGTVAQKLTDEKPDYNNIYATLLEVAQTSKNITTSKARTAFINMKREDAFSLLKRTQILHSSDDIAKIQKGNNNRIRMACRSGTEQFVYERIKGWWYTTIISGLLSVAPIFISNGQLRQKLYDVAYEYADDNLPIDIPDDFGKELPLEDDRMFIQQLRLICNHNKVMQASIRDFYRAYEQRSHWVRDGHIFMDDLEKYENRLVEEWERHFSNMEVELSYLLENTDKEKEKYGFNLYSAIMDMNVLIRPKCSAPFVMRGSYHMLAERRTIGWHVDFIERLKACAFKGGMQNETME